MRLEDFLNKDTMNIFCDASMKIKGKYHHDGCYGARCMIGEENIGNSYRVLTNTTNNNAEICAIREGISLAVMYRHMVKNINIFSDSQISIYGIRDGIYRWKLKKDGKIYGSNRHVPIASQDVFLEIARLIVEQDLQVKFWHQASHVAVKDFRSLSHALHVFMSSNGIRETVDMNLIRYISFHNNVIDQETRSVLLNTDTYHTAFVSPIEIVPGNYEQLKKDLQQVNKKKE